tara:strand:+ start:668 stop:853 length:186 start_codon:yes stop_codon:yes gene_type:complete
MNMNEYVRKLIEARNLYNETVPESEAHLASDEELDESTDKFNKADDILSNVISELSNLQID